MNVNFTFCAAKVQKIFDMCKFVNYILQIFHKKRQKKQPFGCLMSFCFRSVSDGLFNLQAEGLED